jgi:hypothetical protein
MRRRFVPSYYARKAEREVQGHRSTINTNHLAGQSPTSSADPTLPMPSMPSTTPREGRPHLQRPRPQVVLHSRMVRPLLQC